ncbi:MAG TPA: MMPL family transporter [Solirubrobacteraceae bacterium]|nr:MMPL family transporter [Solirubrobacteraceae bacterium]
MQRLMLALDRWLRGHRTPVLITWLALLLIALPFAAKQSDHLSGGGYSIPGSGSQTLFERLPHVAPGAQNARLAIVLVPAGRTTGAHAMQASLARAQSKVATVADVTLAPAARAAAIHQIAAAGSRQRPLVVPLAASVNEENAINLAVELRKQLGLSSPQDSAVAVHLVGQSALWAGLQDLSKKDLATAERTGFPIVALILVAVFGSLVAAALPLALGGVSVLITGAIVYWLSQATEMSVFVTNMASMIGIGVAVDYSLFVLARYRQEVRAGASAEQARATALATSGVAVVFSAATVVTALLGLYLVHATAIRSLALGAIIVVTISVLAASTLLPCLISLLGERTHGQGRVFAWLTRKTRSLTKGGASPQSANSTTTDNAHKRGFWEAWTARVTRRPALVAATAAAVMIALALPALKMHTADGALRQFPPGNETRTGFEAAASVSGRGASTPLEVLVPAAQAATAARALAHDPEVTSVQAAIRSHDRREALIRAVLRDDGESSQAREAVARLRSQLPRDALLGGDAAFLADYRAAVIGSLWKVALFVMGVTFLVLMMLLRSIVLPLKAVVMNLLSVGAAYGVLTLVFGTVETLIPVLVLAVVFGLSMDYEVFLLSRIRERYAVHGDTRRAVSEGLSSSAGTITSAALIMVCVFSVFALTGVPSIKQLGLGCALAIAIDATVVRLVLVPTAMELFGEWNWWLPRGIARVLPDTSIEALGEGSAATAPTG